MRAMHQAIHRAYGDSPHNVQATMKAVSGETHRAPSCLAHFYFYMLPIWSVDLQPCRKAPSHEGVLAPRAHRVCTVATISS